MSHTQVDPSQRTAPDPLDQASRDVEAARRRRPLGLDAMLLSGDDLLAARLYARPERMAGWPDVPHYTHVRSWNRGLSGPLAPCLRARSALRHALRSTARAPQDFRRPRDAR